MTGVFDRIPWLDGLDHGICVPETWSFLDRSVRSAAPLAKNSCRRVSTDSTVSGDSLEESLVTVRGR
jgi:hypothetical protein